MKLLLLVLPKKFLFAANRPNLGPKMLVYWNSGPYFKELFKFGSMKVLKKRTRNMLLNFRERLLEIWLKDVIDMLLPLLKQMPPRQMGNCVLCHFRYKEWKAVTLANRYPPCSSLEN